MSINSASGSLLTHNTTYTYRHTAEHTMLQLLSCLHMQGGAVSVNSASGSLLIHNTTLSNNDAFTAGGAVSVTERKSVTITNSNFSDNTLWWKELAAGGGFYCFLCNSVNISSSHFRRNRAAYGGGAAILQPWQQSLVHNTSFLQVISMLILQAA